MNKIWKFLVWGVGGLLGAAVAYLALIKFGFERYDKFVDETYQRGKDKGVSEASEKISNAIRETSEAKNNLNNKERELKDSNEKVAKYEDILKRYKDNEKAYTDAISDLQKKVRLFSGCPVLSLTYIDVNNKIKSLYDDRMSPWGTSGNPQIAATMRETIDKQIADFGMQRKALEEQLGGCPK